MKNRLIKGAGNPEAGNRETTLLLWLMLLAGLVFGAALICLGKESPLLPAADPMRLSAPPEWPALLSALGRLLPRELCWIAAALLCGFFALGSPLLWLLPFCRGMGDGYLVGMLLRAGWNGLPAALRVLMPALLLSYLLICCCREGLEQSDWLLGCLRGRPTAGGGLGFRGYLLRCGGCLLLLLPCVCAEVGAAAALTILTGV